MSGTLIPLAARGIDPTAAGQAYNSMLETGARIPLIGAQTQQAQAQAGLIGAQTGVAQQQGTALGIQNQMNQMLLGIRQQLYPQILPGGGGAQQPSQGLPWSPVSPQGGGGAAPAPTGGAIGANIVMPGAPSGAPTTAAPNPTTPGAIGAGASPVAAPPASADTTPSSIGVYGSTADTTAAPANGTAPAPAPVSAQPLPAIGGGAEPQASLPQNGPPQPFVSPNGVILPGLGFPVPRLWALGIIQSQNPADAISKAMQDRRQALSQLMAGTIGQNGRADPQLWNGAVRQAFDAGLIDSTQAWQFYGHPERAMQGINSTLAPNEQPVVKQQQALAAGTGTAATENATIPQRNADGTYSVPVQSRAQQLGLTGPTAPGQPAPYGSPLAQKVQTWENPGGVPDQANTSGPGGTPTSSAVGNHQFTAPTWTDAWQHYGSQVVASMTPAQRAMAGIPADPSTMTPAQVQALRGNPIVSAMMFDARAPQLAGSIGTAFPGIPVTDAMVGLAHGFGPDGAKALMRSPQTATLEQVLPQAAAANPTLARQSVGQILTEYAQHYGTGVFQPQALPTQVAGPGAPSGGADTGPPIPTEAQKGIMGVEEGRIKEDQGIVGEAQTAALRAGGTIPTILDLRQTVRANPAAFGAAGDIRTGISNVLQTFGPEWVNRFATLMSGSKFDPANVADQQRAIKEAFNLVTSAESSLGTGTGGVRVGAMLTKLFSNAMPNINMQANAVEQMLNFMLVGNQMARDYAQGASDHFNKNYDSWTANPIANRYSPLTKFDQQWTAPGATTAPQVYEAAANLLNHRTDWSTGLTREQRVEAWKIVGRADPGAKLGALQNTPQQAGQ